MPLHTWSYPKPCPQLTGPETLNNEGLERWAWTANVGEYSDPHGLTFYQSFITTKDERANSKLLIEILNKGLRELQKSVSEYKEEREHE